MASPVPGISFILVGAGRPRLNAEEASRAPANNFDRVAATNWGGRQVVHRAAPVLGPRGQWEQYHAHETAALAFRTRHLPHRCDGGSARVRQPARSTIATGGAGDGHCKDSSGWPRAEELWQGIMRSHVWMHSALPCEYLHTDCCRFGSPFVRLRASLASRSDLSCRRAARS